MLILFDRDATLIEDVPYNGDPAAVRPMPTAASAVAFARRAGCRVGIVSNQSGVARGLLRRCEVQAVNRRVDALLGPFDVIRYCPHGEGDHCPCRKPRPGLVLDAAAALGARPVDCVVIGDTGADVEAGRRAGGRGVLVPTSRTRVAEVRGARRTDAVAGDLLAAVRLALEPAGHALAHGGLPA